MVKCMQINSDISEWLWWVMKKKPKKIKSGLGLLQFFFFFWSEAPTAPRVAKACGSGLGEMDLVYTAIFILFFILQ